MKNCGFIVVGVVVRLGLYDNWGDLYPIGPKFVVVGHYDVRGFPSVEQRVYTSKRNALVSAARWNKQIPYCDWSVEPL